MLAYLDLQTGMTIQVCLILAYFYRRGNLSHQHPYIYESLALMLIWATTLATHVFAELELVFYLATARGSG